MVTNDINLLSGALNVSRETMDRLEIFEDIFSQWSKRINLVAASTTGETWRRHVEDSAQLLLIKPAMRHVVDIGSGGGFPGIILAIMLDENKDSSVHLVESNRKKTAFLLAAKASCAKRAQIHSQRIEDVLPSLDEPEFITARALASLDKLCGLTQLHLTKNTIGLFHKGRGYLQEIEEAHANWDFDLVVHKSVIDADSVILEVSHLRPRNNQNQMEIE